MWLSLVKWGWFFLVTVYEYTYDEISAALEDSWCVCALHQILMRFAIGTGLPDPMSNFPSIKPVAISTAKQAFTLIDKIPNSLLQFHFSIKFPLFIIILLQFCEDNWCFADFLHTVHTVAHIENEMVCVFVFSVIVQFQFYELWSTVVRDYDQLNANFEWTNVKWYPIV